MGWQNANADYRRCLPGPCGVGILPTRSTHRMTPRPLIVRLRNWVGDVVLGVPALRLLQSHGYDLRLVGKPWAGSLLSGEGWTVLPLATGGWRARASQLRQLKWQCRQQDPGFDRRVNALVLPFSMSSALDARLAGLRAVGYAHEGRSLLLHQAQPRQRGRHELDTYWQLAGTLLAPTAPPLPTSINLRVSDEAREAAARRLAAAGLLEGASYAMLGPFAGGTFEGRDKRWPGFAEMAAQATRRWRMQLLICPGPGEEAQARAEFPDALVLDDVPLGEYSALLQRCALMVSNDTGPGHLAAAVGAQLLSVLGPTDARQWGAWGPTVTFVQQDRDWPGVEQVLAAGTRLLQLAAPAR